MNRVISYQLCILLAFVLGQCGVEFPRIYFNESDNEGVVRLRVLNGFNSVHHLFETPNDHYYDGISPNGRYISFIQYDSSNPEGQMWIADIQENTFTRLNHENLAANGIWSPNSQFYLLRTISVATPLWSGENYGFIYICQIEKDENKCIYLEDIQAYPIGWYQDNEHILFKGEDGFFTYHIVDQETKYASFDGLDSTHRWAISSQNALLAIAEGVRVRIFNVETENVEKTLDFPMSGEFRASNAVWSVGGNYLALYGDGRNIVIWDQQKDQMTSIDTSEVMNNAYGFTVSWSHDAEILYLIVKYTIDTPYQLKIFQIQPQTSFLVQVYEAEW